MWLLSGFFFFLYVQNKCLSQSFDEYKNTYCENNWPKNVLHFIRVANPGHIVPSPALLLQESRCASNCFDFRWVNEYTFHYYCRRLVALTWEPFHSGR